MLLLAHLRVIITANVISHFTYILHVMVLETILEGGGGFFNYVNTP